MNFGIFGKRALVLGASSGIGKSIAQALVEEGAKVAICARREEKLRAAEAEIGASIAIACDLSKSGAGEKLVREVTEVWGGIDILVTNIGGPPTGSFDEISNEQWLQAFQGVWLSATDAIRASLPGMRKQKWGRVILVTSMVAKEPFEGLTISNGLRSGLLGLAKSISNEVAADGVTINSILPGYIRTERLNELGVNEAETSGEIPAGRLGEPSELASLAAYLASEQASYITGQAIGCDGGRVRGA